MSMALAHFSLGATLVIIGILLTRQYMSPRIPQAIVAGGIWGMVPDVHWVVPHAELAEQIVEFHGTRWADFFALHYTLDVSDPSNSVETMGLCFALFVLATTVLSAVQYWHTRIHG